MVESRGEARPIGLLIDKGFNEKGYLDDGSRFYGLSYGRYQSERFAKHFRKMHAPKFSGVESAIVCEIEDTGDTIEANIWTPKQKRFEYRMDGYEMSHTLTGERSPCEKREGFINLVAEKWGFRPVIKPKDTINPPDAIVKIEQGDVGD